MARDESSGTPPPGPDRARFTRERVLAFGRREEELLQELADRREERISALARGLVLETIGEVQRLIETDRESSRDPERPIG